MNGPIKFLTARKIFAVARMFAFLSVLLETSLD